MTHTPTPWETGGIHIPTSPKFAIESGKEYLGGVEKKDDAIFIVRACNAHDPLLEAANQALEALDIHPAKTNGFAPRQSKIRAAAKRKLRDAIAQDKSEEEGA